MFIEKTTLHERTIIEHAVSDVFAHLDIAYSLIWDELEDNFMAREQQDIPSYQAERIGKRLLAAEHMIFESLLQYHLTVADPDGRGVEPHLSSTSKMQAAFRANKAHEKCLDAARVAGFRSEKAKEILSKLNALAELPDDQSAPQLEALASELLS